MPVYCVIKGNNKLNRLTHLMNGHASILLFCDHFSSSMQTFCRVPAGEPGFDRNKPCKRMSAKENVHYCSSGIKYFTFSW